MKNVLKFALLTLAVAGVALAGDLPAQVPEIDAGTAASALAVLAGGLLVLRARRKR